MSSTMLKIPVAPVAVAVAVATPAPTVTVKPVVTPEELKAQRVLQGRCTICGKPVAKPGDIGEGSTCHDHIGKLRQTARVADVVPEGHIRMSKACRALEASGISTGAIVTACGGDACTGPVLNACFQVTYVGRGKWVPEAILTTGLKLLKGKVEVKAEAKKAETSGSIVANIVAAQDAERGRK